MPVAVTPVQPGNVITLASNQKQYPIAPGLNQTTFLPGGQAPVPVHNVKIGWTLNNAPASASGYQYFLLWELSDAADTRYRGAFQLPGVAGSVSPSFAWANALAVTAKFTYVVQYKDAQSNTFQGEGSALTDTQTPSVTFPAGPTLDPPTVTPSTSPLGGGPGGGGGVQN